MSDETLTEYFNEAESWSADRERAAASSRRLAWTIAILAASVAVIEAIALVMLLPMKTVVPYTLLVDRQTGFVQELRPIERQQITPDDALVKSFLAQYVIAREGFDIDSLRGNYHKVALWSAGEARSDFIGTMKASNPASPLAALPRRSLVTVEVRSISSLNASTAMIRYATIRTDPGGQPQTPQPWMAVVRYQFSGAGMSAADRMINPLGFQVVRFRRDAEAMVATPPPPPMLVQPSPAGRRALARPTANPGAGNPGASSPAVP